MREYYARKKVRNEELNSINSGRFVDYEKEMAQ